MKRLIALFVLVPSVAFAQASVVAKYRGQYSTPLSAENTVALLKQVAAEVHGGLYKKTSGHNCDGYSCDIICFKDGHGFDVLADSDGAATPTWNPATGLVAGNCELVTDAPPPPPPPPPPPSPVVVGLSPVLARLDAIGVTLARIEAKLDALDAKTTALDVTLRGLASKGWPTYKTRLFGQDVTFKPVQ